MCITFNRNKNSNPNEDPWLIGLRKIDVDMQDIDCSQVNKVKQEEDSKQQKCLPHSKDNKMCSKQRAFVQHDYHDHYRDPYYQEEAIVTCGSSSIPEVLESSSLSSTTSTTKPHRRGPRGGVAEPFPVKLHEMLSSVDDEGLSDVVSWQSHGRCFLIRNPKKFVDEVMPKFFKQSKLTSFQRQVNLYGFSRLTAGRDRGGYYHELFLRGRPDLCKRIIRKRVKGTGTKAASSPDTEPNFYNMETCCDSMMDKSSSVSPSTTLSAPVLLKRENNIDPQQVPSLIFDAANLDSSLSSCSFDEVPEQKEDKRFQVSEVDQEGCDGCITGSSSSGSNDNGTNCEVQKDIHRHQTNHSSRLTLASMISSVSFPTSTMPSRVVSCTRNERPSNQLAADSEYIMESVNYDILHDQCKDSWDELHFPEPDDTSSSFLPEVPPLPATTKTPPQSGDLVFFEGLSFHYLDNNLILEDLEHIMGATH